MSIEWYRFPSTHETECQAALDAANANPIFPIKGKVNGQEAPDENAKTTCWCASITECTDGKWGFPRIPASKLDFHGVPQEDRDAYLAAYVTGAGGAIETYDPAWIPAEEE